MSYKPKVGDNVEVYVRQPFKKHVCSPMTITDVHYNGVQLHYVNAVDNDHEMYELSARLFRLRLLKSRSGNKDGRKR